MKKNLALRAVLALLLNVMAGYAEQTGLSDEAMGSVENGMYRNPYLGFGFNLDGWEILTQEDRQRNASINERALGLQISPDEEESDAVTVMAAKLSGYNDSVIVRVTDLGRYGLFDEEDLDEEEWMELNQEYFRESLEAAYTVNSFSYGLVSVNGAELPCYQAEYSLSSGWYILDASLVYTCFFSENHLVVIMTVADTLEAALLAMRHIVWM